MRKLTDIIPSLTASVIAMAAVTGASLAIEGGPGDLVASLTPPRSAAVRAIAGPFNTNIPVITDRGYAASLADTGGQVRLVSMFYAHCPGVCPLTVQTIRTLERALSPSERSHLGVVLLSLDPTDTPEDLRSFKADHAISSPRWLAVRTVREGDTNSLAEKLGMRHRRLSDGSFDHSVSIALVDAQGRILAETRETSTPDADFVTAVRGALTGTHAQ